MIKAPIALGVYLSGVMTNSSMSSSRKSSITTPPTANNPGMLIVVWDHRNDIKCSHSLSEVPRRGLGSPRRSKCIQLFPCTCLIIFREPIISQSPLHLVDNCQSDRRAPGWSSRCNLPGLGSGQADGQPVHARPGARSLATRCHPLRVHTPGLPFLVSLGLTGVLHGMEIVEAHLGQHADQVIGPLAQYHL